MVADASREVGGSARSNQIQRGELRAAIGWRILRFMTQTLLALPEDVAEELDRRAPNPADRDHLVAEAIRAYLAWPRVGEDASDLAIINANATELNAEAEDALSYQVPL